MTGAAPSLLSSRVICHHDHLVVATLVTCRAFGLPCCFRSLGKLFPLCPEASAGCGCRRAAAAVADLVFQRCYCLLGKLSPSRPPLLEVNARRCGGFHNSGPPEDRPVHWVPSVINMAGLIAIVMDDMDERIPEMARQALKVIAGQINELQTRIAALETQVLAWHKNNPVSQRLATIPGIGPIIATAIAATVPDPSVFRSGREFAAWLRRVP